MKKLLCLLILTTNYCYAQVNLNAGLKAYYPFSGNANDASGNNLNGTIQGGAQLTTDRFGNTNSAYHFNGSDSRILITDNGALSTPSFSICYYFNTEIVRYQVCLGKIEFTTGNGATYNSSVYHPINSTPFYTVTDPAGYPCNQQVPGKNYLYDVISPNSIQTNQWYCVVNTFENGIQKLYIDGVLLEQKSLPFLQAKACTNTNFLIGSWWQGDLLSFQGKIDDVRFYDRAINQQEINSLCSQKIATDSLIINTYTPVTALNPCENKITVEDASTFNIGDTVLMIQMKGAVVDSSNTAAFGNITNYKNAGNYEYNYVKSKTGNIIELKDSLTRSYDISTGKVQLIRVPYFNSISATSTLTCLPWDGNKGGVLVLNVKDTLTLNTSIDVSGRGFSGGKAINSQSVIWQPACGTATYYSGSSATAQQAKGEGIATVLSDKSSGRGPLANGGGGGNLVNSGGGGGSNNTAGGKGGNQFEQCTVTPNDNGGLPGKALLYSSAVNKIFMGGGGGAGDANDPNGASSFNPDGGNGGGIVIIQSNYFNAKNFSIISNGDSGKYCTANCNEGVGGGGAGGTVLLQVNNLIAPVNSVICKGGNGADNTSLSSIYSHGPGGGGSGGVLFINNITLPGSIVPTLSGAQNGVSQTSPAVAWGALPGNAGQVIYKLVLPIDTKPFKKNIDSVRIKSTATSCNRYSFIANAYTSKYLVNQWQWNFGDGNTANTQNSSHSFSTAGTYTIKLVVTDINGCKDSITKSISVAICPTIIINTYTPVTALNPCDNKITVEDASTFNIGDTVLMIQMKGAVIDSSNTAAFGTVTNYKNAGNYEFNYVKSKAGNIIELKDSITRAYDIATGKVQLIRVPYYNTTNIAATLTCLPWDGSKGGVLVLNAKDTVNLLADIDLSGKGFRGGSSPNTGSLTLYCAENNYTYPKGSLTAADKGESIAIIGDGVAWGKGASANAGGGGIGHNSGGGGGANGGAGGFGGYQLESCGNAPFDNRGIGANSLVYSNAQNKVFMGGGGGSGHVDNAGGSDMQGGNGGGIAIIRSNYLKTNGNNIVATGGDAPQCSAPPYSNCHDGGGGGGGGGSILITTNNYLTPAQLNVAGGKGADLAIFDSVAGAGRIGPGGGGGAGITWLNNASLPGTVITILSGGIRGVIPADNNNPWGTTAGQSGNNLFNLQLPIDTKLFKKNIDSVRAIVTSLSCNNFSFKGIAYTAKNPVSQWQWNFGDGNTANTQNTTHSFFTAGTYTISLVITDNNGCKDSTKTTVTSTGSNFDFSYKQNSCNPLSVQFFSIGNNPVNPSWLFGDGGTVAGNATPTHLYASTGIYTVKYRVQNAGCTDTITKIISINILRDDIILTKDTTICFGTTKQLITAPSLGFCWTPTTYLDDPLSANPVTNTPASITYFFTAEIPGNNIITNGDFSAGNSGFTSQYNFANPNITEGEYFVGTNPQSWNPSLSPCTDHTTGNGNMLLVNGAPVGDVSVWNQTVTVTPNTNYAFATWVQALFPPNPAQLSFSINGGDVGDLITASLPTCTWSRFYTTWNSGNNTTASISIINKNIFVQGNDFALDDISFSPVLIKRDSVIISVDKPVVKTNNDTLVCAGNKVQLLASGAATYNWLPSTGLTNAAINNPIATPTGTTQYIVTGTSNKGCTAADTVIISTKALPVITKTADTTICTNVALQLLATGGVTYQWLPVAGLDNAGIPNPKASPTGNITYTVLVTGANSCTATDSVKVAVRPTPVFTVSPADTTCYNTAVQLNASGGDVYAWSPALLVNNPNIANPTTTSNTNTTYTVAIKEIACNNSVTLSTTVTVLPVPVIKASKSNDINCSIVAAQLSATGSAQFLWSPAGSLNNSTIANPVASPSTTTLYFVTATDFTTNCIATDTITVFVNKGGIAAFFIPSAFTPNGDGVNDCFKVKHFSFLKSVDISIYNRFGNLVFHTTSDNDCWNGTYKGNPAEIGNYVYYIKAEDNCEIFYKKGNLILLR